MGASPQKQKAKTKIKTLQEYLKEESQLCLKKEHEFIIKLMLNETKIGKNTMETFKNLYYMDPSRFTKEMHIRILPVQKKGSTWDSVESKMLRNQLKNSGLELLSLLSPSTIVGKDYIFGPSSVEIMSNDDLETFGIWVQKKPKKRSGEETGIACWISTLSVMGKTYRCAILVEVKTEKRKGEGNLARLLLKRLKEIVEKNIVSYKSLLDAFYDEVNIVGETIKSVNPSAHASAAIVVRNEGKNEYYVYSVGAVNLAVWNGGLRYLAIKNNPQIGENYVEVKASRKKMLLKNGNLAVDFEIFRVPNLVILSSSAKPDEEEKIKAKNVGEFLKYMKKMLKKKKIQDDLGVLVFK